MAHPDGLKTFGRQIVYLVRIYPDRCLNVYGVSPCTASGGQCSYSWETCEDKTNYKKGKQTLKIQSADTDYILLGDQVLPYLLDIQGSPIELDPMHGININARLELTFLDDPLPPPADHDKGSGKYHTGRTGTFWTNWLARNRNFKGRRIQLLEGYTTYTESQFETLYDYLIEDIIRQEDGTYILTASDHTSRIRGVTVPQGQSSENKLEADITNATAVLTVTDASEFQFVRHGTLWKFARSGGAGFTLEVGEWEWFSDQDDSTYSGSQYGAAYVPDDDAFYWSDNAFGAAVLYKTNRVTGAVTNIGSLSPGIQPVAFAWNPNTSKLYASTGTALYEVNRTTAGTTSVGSHGGTYNDIQGLAMNATVLYGVDNATDSLVTINLSTGAATLVGAIGIASINPQGLAYNLIDDFFYTLDTSNGSLVELTTATGAGRLIVTDSSADGFLEFVVLENDAYLFIEDDTNGDEYVRMTVINGNLVSVERGLLGTTAVSHLTGTKVRQGAAFLTRGDTGVSTDTGVNVVDAITDLLHLWAGVPYHRFDWAAIATERGDHASWIAIRRFIAFPTDGEKLIQLWALTAGGYVFQNESGRITFRVLRPDDPHTTGTSWDTEGNITSERNLIREQQERTVSRVVVFYSPDDIWGLRNHNDEDEFSGREVIIDADVETPNNLNDVISERFKMDHIFTSQVARTLGNRFLRRWSKPPRIIDTTIDKKDGTVQVGGLVDVTLDEVVDQTGAAVSRNYQLVRKREDFEGGLQVRLIATKFERTFAWIGHTGAADHGAATDLEKKHAYIGAGDGATLDGYPTLAKMGDGTDGYYIQ